MGKTILILMAGFATSFGLMSNSMNSRYLDSIDRAVHQFADYSANNASASGAYMALNRLYQNSTWRAGYNKLMLAGDTINVTIQDKTTVPALGDFRIRILSNGINANATELTKVTIFDGHFDEFAIWAKDSVTNATTNDALGNPDTTLLIENAPFMPEIDYDGLVAEASSQLHEYFGNFTPAPNYPNTSFYYFGTTPNVTHVGGNLTVLAGRTVFGIYIVEGNVSLAGNARVNGIIYCPNPSSIVSYGGGNPNAAEVTGGIVTWGTIDGTGNHIDVTYNATYMQSFVKNYAPENPPMRVLTWE